MEDVGYGQVLKHDTRQDHDQSYRQDQSQGQSHSQYQNQLQDAKYDARQAEIQSTLLNEEVVDGPDPEEPDLSNEDDFDSEIGLGDEDDVNEERPDLSAISNVEELAAQGGGFMGDSDAIYVVPFGNGRWKCLLDEDLSLYAFERNRRRVTGMSSTDEMPGEPSRTTCYRELARWLEKDYSNVLADPAKLLECLESSGCITQTAFLRDHFASHESNDLKKWQGRLSEALKDAYLVWHDYSMPLRNLFKK